MKRKIVRYSTLLLMATLFLSGCTGNKSMQTQEMTADQTVYTEGAVGAVAESKAQGAEEMAVQEDSGGGEAKDSAAKADPKAQQDRKLIKTVSLSIETTDFDALKGQVEETVTSFGGYIENSDYSALQGGGQLRSYSVTARIPVDKLDAFVEETGWKGTITNKSENVEDVTLDYVDKTAYKESLQKEYERVMQLLEQAKDLDQILLLESKLSDLRYEINSYESQLRVYDNQIDYSSIHIYISEVEYENGASDTVGGRIHSGFRSSLHAVKNFFVNLFVEVVSDLPILLVWACAVAVLIFVILKLKKKVAWKAPKANRAQEKREEDNAKGD